MVIGYHLIWTIYGWWLPNDIRGSSSHAVRNKILAELGDLHLGRKKIQPTSAELKQFHSAARAKLQHEVVKFSEHEIKRIADSFARVIKRESYTCYACAIMPDHIHLVIRKHRDLAEMMMFNFQNESLQAVLACGERELEHPVWGGPGWKVYLEDQADFASTIKYVENNPITEDRPLQAYEFVTPSDGWMPGLVSRLRPDLRNRKQEVCG
jgi:REP element-mobilizing transposase RayT